MCKTRRSRFWARAPFGGGPTERRVRNISPSCPPPPPPGGGGGGGGGHGKKKNQILGIFGPGRVNWGAVGACCKSMDFQAKLELFHLGGEFNLSP